MIKLKDIIDKYGEQYIDEEKLKEVIAKPKGGRKPQCGEVYWCIGSARVYRNRWLDTEIDNYSFKTHNCFVTEEECRTAKAIQDYCIEHSFEPNWKDEDQIKWYILFNYNDDYKIHVIGDYQNGFGARYYFSTKKLAQSLIDSFSKKDIMKYYFHVYD